MQGSQLLILMFCSLITKQFLHKKERSNSILKFLSCPFLEKMLSKCYVHFFLKVTDEMREESSQKRMQAMTAMNEGL